MAAPASQNPAQGFTVPEELQKQYPELIALIRGSESMNDEERQYWINILPIMTPEQIQNLFGILENEKKQLAAIDAKYQNDMQKLSTADTTLVANERRKRRAERASSEQEAVKAEEGAAEAILRKIEEAGTKEL